MYTSVKYILLIQDAIFWGVWIIMLTCYLFIAKYESSKSKKVKI